MRFHYTMVGPELPSMDGPVVFVRFSPFDDEVMVPTDQVIYIKHDIHLDWADEIEINNMWCFENGILDPT